MVLPIESLYELSFNLIYQLRIQPSEVNDLTIHESRSYIKYYDELKRKEAEAYDLAKQASQANNLTNKITPNRYIRRNPRRR